MIKTLKPSNYYKGLKLSLVPKNKIDTVTIKMPLNTVSGIKDLGSLSIKQTDFNSFTQDRISLGHSYDREYGNCYVHAEAGKSVVHVQYMHVVKRFELDTPVVGTPTVEFSLNGSTVKTVRSFEESYSGNSINWTDGPNYNNQNWEWLRSWIDSHKYGDTESWIDASNYIDYLNGGVPLVPCVKRKVSSPTSDQQNVSWYYDSGEGLDMWTTGMGSNILNSSEVNIEEHSDSISSITVRPYNSSYGSIGVGFLSIKSTVTVISPYIVEVDFWIPVKVTAFMAVRLGTEYNASGWHFDPNTDMDTKTYSWFAFYEDVEEISVTLQGQTLETDDEEFGYSLDNEGHLTTTLKNNYPFNIEEVEFLSSNAKWGTDYWHDRMIKHILTSYINGKYISEVTLPAEWCIQNDIKVNSQLTIMLQDGSLVLKNDRARVFNVKTIEKRFKDSEFVYNIKLLEEETYAVVTDGGIVYAYASTNEITTNTTYYVYGNTSGQTKAAASVPAMSSIMKVGYKCVVCATDTIVSEALFLPGKGSNNLLVAIKIPSGTEVSVEKFALWNLSESTVYATSTDIVVGTSGNYSYYCARLIKQNVPTGVVVKLTTANIVSTLYLQIYNVESNDYTASEAFDYLKSNNKLK